MGELASPLSPDTFSHVLRKLIDATSRATTGESGLQQIYKEALTSLDSIGVERASILLFDPDGVMRFKAWLGISDSYRKRVEGHTPWSQVDINPPPLIVPDVYKDESLAPHIETFASEEIRALAFIPLLYRSKVIGKFMLYSKKPYNFAQEIEPASAIAQLVAYAVVRKKIEEQLSLSETRLKSILENEPECVNIISPEGVIIEMNPAGLNLLEVCDQSEVIGTNIYPLIMEEYRSDFRHLTERVCHGEKGTMEFELMSYKGTKRFLEIHAVPFYRDEYKRTFLLAITSDVTNKKRVELERENLFLKEKEARLGAEKSIQLRDDFLSIATHELKTPLTPILMNFQLMGRYIRSVASDFSKGDMLLKLLDSTDIQFDRFLKLVENLLDVSRITADRLVLDMENFNLSHLLQEILEKYQPSFRDADCTLSYNIEENIIGNWDRIRIEQVVVNLLTNAMKYGMGCPVELVLSLDKDPIKGAIAKLVVRDHGIGIAKEDLGKIFSRFERVASANYYGGLGLGLFISSNIVSVHGGSIKVESELGKGSTFIVELPLMTE